MAIDTQRYTVHFHDCAGNKYMGESFTFCVPTGGKMSESLEEQLYVHNELTPLNPHGYHVELATKGFTYFAYHCTEVFLVTYMWDNSHDIQVYDCSPEVTAMVLNS